MAVYGLGTPGQIPFTGYSPTLGVGNANAPSTAGYVAFNGINQSDELIMKMMRNGSAAAKMRALFKALMGVAPGGVATASYKRVAAVTGDNHGGARGVETVTVMNRATTAADQTALMAMLDRTVFPPAYPVDVSGNGGGGKGGW